MYGVDTILIHFAVDISSSRGKACVAPSLQCSFSGWHSWVASSSTVANISSMERFPLLSRWSALLAARSLSNGTVWRAVTCYESQIWRLASQFGAQFPRRTCNACFAQMSLDPHAKERKKRKPFMVLPMLSCSWKKCWMISSFHKHDASTSVISSLTTFSIYIDQPISYVLHEEGLKDLTGSRHETDQSED